MKLLLTIICAINFTSCVSVRDENTYKLELTYIQKGLEKQNKIVHSHIQASCCKGNVFLDNDRRCVNMVDVYHTIKTRTSYHAEMMKFLGGMQEKKPEIPKLDIKSEFGKVCLKDED